jgi:hypothetical protein
MDYLNYLNPNVLVALKTAILIISLDTIIGWIIAGKNGEFSWEKAPQFLIKNVLPYVGALTVLAIYAHLDEYIMPIFLVAVGLVDIKFGKDIIIEKIKGLFN